MNSVAFRRPVTVRERLHALVERLLPWFDVAEARQHDARSEAIVLRSIRAQRRSADERDRVAVAVRNTVDGVRGR